MSTFRLGTDIGYGLGPVLGGAVAASAGYEAMFRCTVTNGDGTATLTADVHIVVLDVAEPASEEGGAPAYDPAGKSGKLGKGIPQLGDEQLAGLAAMAGAGVFASLALMLAMMRSKRREEEEVAE